MIQEIALLMQRSTAIPFRNKQSCIAKRRLSLYFDDKIEDFEESGNSQNLESTSIRNQVLVSLQEHERKDLSTKVKNSDIVNTWKSAARKKKSSFNASLHEMNSKRVENISWRLWFKDNLVKSLERTRTESDGEFYISEIVASILPFSGKRVFSPQDLYSFECESIDYPSSISLKAKRFNLVVKLMF